MPLAPARPSPVRAGLPRAGLFAGLAVAAGLLVFLLLLGSSSEPRRVARLTVTNPSPYQVNLEISDSRQERWLDLGAVGRERTRTVEELPDLGEAWVFRFSSSGVDGGRLEVTRAALRDAGWKITVPAEVTARFEEAGLTPSAA
ncbi:MAG TPA: hypothetical protein VHH09_01415 [Acidimicrobiales bacterium]|nr:hypothetical protein [Acidimicrobiales bacterium]